MPLRDMRDTPTILAITSVVGVIPLRVALRLLELKSVRVANFLPTLLLAPVFIRLAEIVRQGLSG